MTKWVGLHLLVAHFNCVAFFNYNAYAACALSGGGKLLTRFEFLIRGQN